MNIVALLAWYDEPVDWLTRTVKSLAEIPVDHLVAVDGAYALYPDAKPSSPPEQHQAIQQACADTGIRDHIYIPDQVYADNEIEKRNELFALAETWANPDDWYMVIDADEYVTEAPHDTRLGLQQTPFDVAAVVLDEPGHPLGTIRYSTFPMFFRAIPGLRCDTAHYRYRTPDGRLLWGDAKRDRLEPRHQTGVHVEHLTKLRHTDRSQAANTYYRNRDERGLEDLPAQRWVTA